MAEVQREAGYYSIKVKGLQRGVSLPACLLASLLACLLAYLPTLSASFNTFLSPFIFTYLSSWLFSSFLVSVNVLTVYTLSFFLHFIPFCLLVYFRPCLPAFLTATFTTFSDYLQWLPLLYIVYLCVNCHTLYPYTWLSYTPCFSPYQLAYVTTFLLHFLYASRLASLTFHLPALHSACRPASRRAISLNEFDPGGPRAELLGVTFKGQYNLGRI